MTQAALSVETVEAALRRWLASVEYASYDPYDGLSGSWPWSLARRNRIAARLLMQIVKSSPLNLRPVLGIPQRVHAKSLADLASAALLRRRLATDAQAEPDARLFLERLRHDACAGFSGACWALRTPYVSRFVNSHGGEPNLFWTIAAAVAFVEAWELDRNVADLATARSALEFVRRDLGFVEEPDGSIWFRYFQGHDAAVYNVTALTGAFLCRLAHHTGETELAELGMRALRFVLRAQNADGSWFYARGSGGRWVDGFHTGYVLESLLQVVLQENAPDLRTALQRGAEFYARHLFDADAVPRYSTARRTPIDVQNCAQAIQTLARLAWLDRSYLERASRTANAVIAQLFISTTHAPQSLGYFAASRGRWSTNRTPMVRWGQAPMLLALDSLLAAERGLRPAWEPVGTPRPA